MIEWKDITTYSQGDKEREPSSLQAEIEDIRIVIHQHIHYPNGELLLTAKDLGYNMMDLKTTNWEKAKEIAENFIKLAISRKIAFYQKILREIKR